MRERSNPSFHFMKEKTEGKGSIIPGKWNGWRDLWTNSNVSHLFFWVERKLTHPPTRDVEVARVIQIEKLFICVSPPSACVFLFISILLEKRKASGVGSARIWELAFPLWNCAWSWRVYANARLYPMPVSDKQQLNLFLRYALIVEQHLALSLAFREIVRKGIRTRKV